MFKRRTFTLRLAATGAALVALFTLTIAAYAEIANSSIRYGPLTLAEGWFSVESERVFPKPEVLDEITIAPIDLLANTCLAGNTVEVAATLGTASPTNYSTLKLAFDAINAGTHRGEVTIKICANTSEGTTPATLNSSGAGSASYTSVNVFPTVDGVSISGSPAAGFGVIQFNGADNVTLDGDNPNTPGTNRNMSLTNTASSTTNNTSVVRLALSSLISSANNNTIRNLVMTGNATGRNVSTATSLSSSEYGTYCILVGGNASSVDSSAAPAAISSVTSTIGAGITATNFNASNNLIDSCARGIAVQGSAVTVANGLTITNNIIGNAVPGNTTTVYARGMTLQGFDNATISGNTIRNIEGFASAAIQGIGLGDVSPSGANAIIERNTVSNVLSRNTGTVGSYGISLNAGVNNVIRNNFVTGIKQDMTGGASFSTAVGVFGIRVAGGTGTKVLHNSVNLYGTYSGTEKPNLLSAALCITSTSWTGLEIRNNILSNTQTSGTTGIAHVSLYLPSGGTSSMNLTLNNNDYFTGSDTTRQGIAQVGIFAGTGFYVAANFDAGVTSPSANLRSYTDSLSAVSGNDNRSVVVNPLFTSDTDLHIQITSILESKGANAGVALDFDGDARGTTPDIGADEIGAVTPNATNLSASETYTEDTPLNLTDIVVSDADSSNVAATLTLSSISAGILSTGTSGSTTSAFNPGTGVWTASGPIADVNALLAGLVFNPALNFNSNFTIATNVTDGTTSPVTGSKAMTGTPVNDAPTATNLSAVETYTEDTNLDLSDIAVSDVDNTSLTVTLTLGNKTAGSLSTSTVGSTSSTFDSSTAVWRASGPIPELNALLAGVSFIPTANFNSTFTITSSVDDGAAPPTTGIKVMTGTSVNDAPVLDASRNPVLSTIERNSGAPAGPVGTLISNLVDFASTSGQVDNVTDVDSGALLGIAVTGSNSANGTWFYTIDNGTTWSLVGPASDSNTLLLAADSNSRLYFQPNGGFSGAIIDGITFRAWDRTSGANGTTVADPPTGGTAAFSTALDTASITVSTAPTSVGFSSSTYAGPEGFSATITVMRSGDLSGTSSADWSASGTGGGSCSTVGVDYESASGTLAFGPGDTQKTFTVLLCKDVASDNGESVLLNLTNVQGAVLVGSGSATLQILDAASEFTNMQPLTVGSGSPSSPYGVSVDVSGHTSISGLKLTLFGVNYANPDDLDVLLVGPGGEAFVAIADVGGSTALSNATVTLEDGALLRLPDSDAITDGQNYRPAACTASGTVGAFPPPAPVTAYRQAGCTSESATFSSVFGNTNPNGTWTLYVRDDNGDPVVDGGGGSIAGWGIQMLAPTAAQVSVSGSVRTPQEMGIRGAVVTITGGGMGEPMSAVTGTFGAYHFRNVPAGVSYVVTVRSRRYAFAQPSRMISVRDNVSGFDFVSEP